jgi:hypothetical protein
MVGKHSWKGCWRCSCPSMKTTDGDHTTEHHCPNNAPPLSQATTKTAVLPRVREKLRSDQPNTLSKEQIVLGIRRWVKLKKKCDVMGVGCYIWPGECGEKMLTKQCNLFFSPIRTGCKSFLPPSFLWVAFWSGIYVFIHKCVYTFIHMYVNK